MTPQLTAFFEAVKSIGAELGQQIAWKATGGCCDGNDLAAFGLTNVDSLGIFGGGIHSPNEFAHVDSVPPRAAAVAEVLRRAAERHRSERQPSDRRT